MNLVNLRLLLLASAALGLGDLALGQYCNPGSSGTIACPCGNAPLVTPGGCNNSANTGGAAVTAYPDPASISMDSVVVTAVGVRPNSLSILFECGLPGPTQGAPYGDGVRCISQPFWRAGTAHNADASGGWSYPRPGIDASISAWDAAHGHPIPPYSGRYYQVAYRDPAAFACSPPAMFNVSNMTAVVWVP